MDKESRFVAWKVFMDFCIFNCVAFPLLVLTQWVEPYQRGYFRDDRSLMLPYRPYTTIPAWLLFVVGLLPNIVLVASVELARARRGGNLPKYRLMGYRVPASAVEIYRVLGVFLFGVACVMLTTYVGKVGVGRLRPHFFSVCDPLANSTLPDEVYVQQFTCRGTDAALLWEMRLSFPSGHASFSAYALIFFALYMQWRFKWGSNLLRHGLQFVAVLLAWYIGLSRVADNVHNASDVAVGMLLGALHACLVFAYIYHLGEKASRAAWRLDVNRTFGSEISYPVAVTPGPA